MSGASKLGARLQEAAAFREIRRQHAAPFAAKTRQLAQHAQAAAHGHAHRVDAARAVAEDEIRMILQVAADAGQVGVHGDALLLEFAARADARQHQQLRRLQRAGREYDFTPRAGVRTSPRCRTSTPIARVPSNRMRSTCACVSTVRLSRRPTCGSRYARAALHRSPCFCVMVEADAFLLRAVEIVGERQAGLPRGFQVARMERLPVRRSLTHSGPSRPCTHRRSARCARSGGSTAARRRSSSLRCRARPSRRSRRDGRGYRPSR